MYNNTSALASTAALNEETRSPDPQVRHLTAASVAARILVGQHHLPGLEDIATGGDVERVTAFCSTSRIVGPPR